MTDADRERIEAIERSWHDSFGDVSDDDLQWLLALVEQQDKRWEALKAWLNQHAEIGTTANEPRWTASLAMLLEIERLEKLS